MTQIPQIETPEGLAHQVVLRDHPEKHQYTAALGADGAEAIVQYTRVGTTLLIRHTEVPDHLSGHGFGTAVMRAVFDDARARGLLITPFCPFASAFVRRHPEYADLVSRHARATLGL